MRFKISKSTIRTVMILLAVLSVLFIPALSFSQGVSYSEQQTLMLRAKTPDLSDRSSPTLLIRELIRQSVLIAARDGLGLNTRDMALRERMEDEQRPVDIHISARWKEPWSLDLTRQRNAGKVDTWQDEIITEKPGNITQLVQIIEARSRGPWIEKLQNMGFAGRSVRQNPDAFVPLQAMEQLDQMNMISQFAAVRTVHQTIRNEGESPDLLGALVRGYANLGQLTRPLMNGSHKVFRARAILYSQRLAVMDNNSPYSLSQQAYAWAMAGWHSRAISTLERIKQNNTKLSESQNQKKVLPPNIWQQMIERYVRYDTDGLRQLVDRSNRHRSLAEFLAFLTVKYRAGDSLIIEMGNQTLYSSNMTCYRVLDEMNQAGGIRVLHQTTIKGPVMINEMLQTHMEEIDQLPQSVSRSLNVKVNDSQGYHNQARQVADRLIEAGQQNDRDDELSWQVLGIMIQELNFRVVWWRVHFMATRWSVEVDQYLTQVRNSIANHPYAQLVEMYAITSPRDSQKYYEMVKDVQIIDATFMMYQIMKQGRYFGDDNYNPCFEQWEQIFLKMDWVADDLLEGIKGHTHAQAKIDLAKSLSLVSPDCPFAIATLIDHQPDIEREHFGIYFRKHANNPVVLRALAKAYINDQSWDKAKQALEKHLVLEANRWTYEQLAEVYLKQGDQRKWQQTLDNYLDNVSDYGLDHAWVRVNMARRFMKLGDFQLALPYAKAAAESYSGWAMQCLANCYEGLGQYDLAEQWIANNARRYKSSNMGWYFWCRRTGRGDIAEARKIAARYMRNSESKPTRYDLMNKGVFLLLENENQQAYKAFKQAHQMLPRPYTGLHVYLLAIERNDVDIMKNTIDATRLYVQNNNRFASHKISMELFELIDNHYHLRGQFDYDQADEIIKSGDEETRAKLQYFLARYLESIKFDTQAVEYYKLSAGSSLVGKWNCILANDALNKRGIKPPAYYRQKPHQPGRRNQKAGKRTNSSPPPAPR